ncbi:MULTISPECIES: YwqG family protein [Streptomyces]|uniref:DUF1963 domain-containing protein n=1 Tax=Streptomyces prasinus TaxID=67345 RepID=A0ABX6AWS2_9ACTN|nr:DUF1963 domain-containing protein [Streptomyces prasinus]QEV06444.1 DUF1963 domain-containing protein [Streptomyces prasinus]
MSYTDEFRAFARRHGVSDDSVTRVMWMMQPSVHLDILDPSEVGPDDLVVGHTGGLPELPDGVAWDGDVYVAGLDLAAIPEQPLDLGLPREGHLLFFTSSGYEDGDPAPVVHVPAGSATAVRPAPSGTYSEDPSDTWTTDVLERRVLVCRTTGTSWDVLDWLWDPGHDIGGTEAGLPDLEDPDVEDEVRPLLAAFTEYAERVGTVPFVRRTCGLRGVELNPPYYRADYGTDFLKKGEEAVAVCRNEPERFDELYAEALRDACEQEGGPWLNLLEFGEDAIFHTGDGEVGWLVNRDDLLAGRFDDVVQSYHC